MQILTTAAALRSYAATARRAGQRLGLVPTMGALHPGHLALLRRAHATTDAVVATVFVNPTQFNNPDDFRLYPRLLEADATLLEAAGCSVLFAPSPEEMYPAPTVLRFDFGPLERVMEGAHRPGHFHGVATVVSKLLHLAQPHQAFFGQKDWQQLAVVRQLVADLSFDVEIVGCPTVREVDGLAMSSRNRRLTPEGRAVAPLLYQVLQAAAAALAQGVAPAAVQAQALATLADNPRFGHEYVEVADAHTLQPLATFGPGQEAVICLAAHLDGVRLIDNIVVGG